MLDCFHSVGEGVLTAKNCGFLDAGDESMASVKIINATCIFNADGKEVGEEAMVERAVINYYCSTATHKDYDAVSDNTEELILVTKYDCASCGE